MRKIELVLWFRCNCNCIFCAQDEGTRNQAMSTAAAIRHMEQSRREGATEIDFGGGEPTLRRDLPKLARVAQVLGYRHIGVKSNGMRLCYPEYLAQLMKAGVQGFTVPIWGHAPALHDELARTPGAFDAMEMAIKHIVDFGGHVKADVLLTTRGLPHLRETIEYFSSLGVRRFQMWLYSLFGARNAFPELLPTMTAAGKAILLAHGGRRRGRSQITTSHIPPCFFYPQKGIYTRSPLRQLRIVTPGGAFPAEASPFEAGVKTRGCARCARREVCGGVRPEYLERFSDREIVPISGRKTAGA